MIKMNQNIEIVSLIIVIVIQSMHFFLKHGFHQISKSLVGYTEHWQSHFQADVKRKLLMLQMTMRIWIRRKRNKSFNKGLWCTSVLGVKLPIRSGGIILKIDQLGYIRKYSTQSLKWLSHWPPPTPLAAVYAAVLTTEAGSAPIDRELSQLRGDPYPI